MKKKNTVIKWIDSVTIENINEKRDGLLKAFDKGLPVILDVSKLNHTDITAIQIVIACQKEAVKRGLDFSLAGDITPSVLNICLDIGIPIGNITTGEELSSEVIQKLYGSIEKANGEADARTN